VTLGAAGQSVSSGVGTDAITATLLNALGSTFTGGLGADVLNITYPTVGGQGLTLGATAVSGGAAAISSIETLNIVLTSTTQTLSITPDVAMTVNISGNFDESVTGTGGTITVGKTAGNPLALAGTSSYIVTGGVSGVVTSTQTAGTLAVTLGAGVSSVSSTVATTLDAALLNNTLAIAGTGSYTITGAGTAGLGTITEASSHILGALTITTAGANAFTLAENAAGLGAVTINIAGTNTVTLLPLATHASHTINSSGATGGYVTASGAAGAVNFTSTAGAKLVTMAAQTVAVVDTITGFTGVDSINGGLGGDIIASGGGADVITILAGADTGFATGFAYGAVVPASGTVISAVNMDKISGLAVGAKIQVAASVTAATGASATVDTFVANTTTPITRNGETMQLTSAGSLVMVTGTYDAAAGTFTVGASGTSTILAYDPDGTTAVATPRAVILVGYVDSGATDTWATTGLFTVV
jgi:hypothetical protein